MNSLLKILSCIYLINFSSQCIPQEDLDQLQFNNVPAEFMNDFFVFKKKNQINNFNFWDYCKQVLLNEINDSKEEYYKDLPLKVKTSLRLCFSFYSNDESRFIMFFTDHDLYNDTLSSSKIDVMDILESEQNYVLSVIHRDKYYFVKFPKPSHHIKSKLGQKLIPSGDNFLIKKDNDFANGLKDSFISKSGSILKEEKLINPQGYNNSDDSNKDHYAQKGIGGHGNYGYYEAQSYPKKIEKLKEKGVLTDFVDICDDKENGYDERTMVTKRALTLDKFFSELGKRKIVDYNIVLKVYMKVIKKIEELKEKEFFYCNIALDSIALEMPEGSPIKDFMETLKADEIPEIKLVDFTNVAFNADGCKLVSYLYSAPEMDDERDKINYLNEIPTQYKVMRTLITLMILYEYEYFKTTDKYRSASEGTNQKVRTLENNFYQKYNTNELEERMKLIKENKEIISIWDNLKDNLNDPSHPYNDPFSTMNSLNKLDLKLDEKITQDTLYSSLSMQKFIDDYKHWFETGFDIFNEKYQNVKTIREYRLQYYEPTPKNKNSNSYAYAMLIILGEMLIRDGRMRQIDEILEEEKNGLEIDEMLEKKENGLITDLTKDLRHKNGLWKFFLKNNKRNFIRSYNQTCFPEDENLNFFAYAKSIRKMYMEHHKHNYDIDLRKKNTITTTFHSKYLLELVNIERDPNELANFYNYVINNFVKESKHRQNVEDLINKIDSILEELKLRIKII